MQANGIDFVPMIYGNCCGIDDLPGSLPDSAKTLLGFNEPNHWCASALWLHLEPGRIRDAVPIHIWRDVRCCRLHAGKSLGYTPPRLPSCGPSCRRPPRSAACAWAPLLQPPAAPTAS